MPWAAGRRSDSVYGEAVLEEKSFFEPTPPFAGIRPEGIGRRRKRAESGRKAKKSPRKSSKAPPDGVSVNDRYTFLSIGKDLRDEAIGRTPYNGVQRRKTLGRNRSSVLSKSIRPYVQQRRDQNEEDCRYGRCHRSLHGGCRRSREAQGPEACHFDARVQEPDREARCSGAGSRREGPRRRSCCSRRSHGRQCRQRPGSGRLRPQPSGRPRREHGRSRSGARRRECGPGFCRSGRSGRRRCSRRQRRSRSALHGRGSREQHRGRRHRCRRG